MSGEVKWQHVLVDEVLVLLETDRYDLITEEVQFRFSIYGFNEVELKKKESSLHRFAR